MNRLDDILQSIAKQEDDQSDRAIGVSLLSDIHQRIVEDVRKAGSDTHKKTERYREYAFHIETKTYHLLLIVRRLREAVKSPFFRAAGVETKTIHYFLIDLESFFYFLQSTLDLVAKLTPYFYPSGEKKIPHRSFRKMRKWFEKHADIDSEYSRNLIDRTSWFDELKKHRDYLAHNYSVSLFFGGAKSTKPYFGSGRNKQGFIPTKDALEYVDKSANDLIEFLNYLNSYFGQK